MPSVTGQVTPHDVSEHQIQFVLEFRQKRKNFAFALNALVPFTQKPGTYNNCTFSWNSEEGMKEAYELTHKLVQGHDSIPRYQ